jgi:pimeloyl-ACP methyl ester carboxylesterase
MSPDDPEQQPRIRRGKGLRLSTSAPAAEPPAAEPPAAEPPAAEPPARRGKGLRLSTSAPVAETPAPEAAPVASRPMLTRQRIDTARGPLSYITHGTGKPLLLLHGWGASARIWSEVAATAGLPRRLYALDMPGAGNAPIRAAAPTLNALAAEVLAFADALGLERFDLLGHALGAATAAIVAAHHPRRVGHMALLGLGVRGFAPELLALGLSRLSFDFSFGVTRPLVDLWKPFNRAFMQSPPLARSIGALVLHGQPASLELWKDYLADHASADARAYVTSLTMPGDPTLHAALREVSIPTIYIVGREDRVTRLAEAKEAYIQTPGSELQVIDNCGHLIMAEQPEALNQALRGFFR